MAVTGHDVTAANLPYRSDVAALTSGGIGGTSKLWLPAWSGMVILAYDKYRNLEPLVDSRVVSAPAIEFPITGTVSGQGVWSAGTELIGSVTDNISKTFAIRIDKRPIVSFFELDNVDLSLTQWEFKSELARQAGEWIANLRDAQIAVYLLRAGIEDWIDDGGGSSDPRAASSFFPPPVNDYTNLQHLGNTASTADLRTTAAAKMLEYAENYCVHMAENNIPLNDPIMLVSPRAFQDIRALGIARDATGLAGGAGRPLFGGVAEAGGVGQPLGTGLFNMGDYLEWQGVKIIKTNHLGTGGVLNANSASTTTYGEAKYNLKLDTIKVKAIIFQRDAICAIRMGGVDPFSMYDGRRNTTFVRVSMHAGTGTKRPELVQLILGANGLTATRAAVQTEIGASWTDEFVNTASGAYPY